MSKARYELWKDENSYSFFPKDNESAKNLLSAEASLIWTVDADSWEEANRMKNEYLGWETYTPFTD